MRLSLAFGVAVLASTATAFAGSADETTGARSNEISAFAAAALGSQPATAEPALGATRSVAKAYAPYEVDTAEFALVQQYKLRAAETRTTITRTPVPAQAGSQTVAVSAPAAAEPVVTGAVPARKTVAAPRLKTAAVPARPVATRVALETSPQPVDAPRRKISLKNYFMIGVLR